MLLPWVVLLETRERTYTQKRFGSTIAGLPIWRSRTKSDSQVFTETLPIEVSFLHVCVSQDMSLPLYCISQFFSGPINVMLLAESNPIWKALTRNPIGEVFFAPSDHYYVLPP